MSRFKFLFKIYDYDGLSKRYLDLCPGCKSKSDSFRPFGEIDRYGYKTKTSYCINCGMIFVNPRLSVEDYQRFYEEDKYRKIIQIYKNKEKLRVNDNYELPKNLKAIKTLLPELIGSKEDISILHIGGAKRDFKLLDSVLSVGKYICVNPCPNEMAEEGGRCEVISSTFEEYEGNEICDLVCLFATIDHLLEPMEIFEKISSLLSEDGLFVFDCTNRLNQMKRRIHPSIQIQMDHTVYPSSGTISFMLKKAGLYIYRIVDLSKEERIYVTGKQEKLSIPYESLNKEEIFSLAKQIKTVPLKWKIKYLLKKLGVFSLN